LVYYSFNLNFILFFQMSHHSYFYHYHLMIDIHFLKFQMIHCFYFYHYHLIIDLNFLNFQFFLFNLNYYFLLQLILKINNYLKLNFYQLLFIYQVSNFNNHQSHLVLFPIYYLFIMKFHIIYLSLSLKLYIKYWK
jgi:hypothetical protein